MEPLTQDDLTLLRICFYERIKTLKRMREHKRPWTRAEVDLGVSQVKTLALKFGMNM